MTIWGEPVCLWAELWEAGVILGCPGNGVNSGRVGVLGGK